MVRQISVFENNFVLDSHFLLRQNFQETIWNGLILWRLHFVFTNADLILYLNAYF